MFIYIIIYIIIYNNNIIYIITPQCHMYICSCFTSSLHNFYLSSGSLFFAHLGGMMFIEH